MPYTICEPCLGTGDTACIDVCPVDCIHGPQDPNGAGEETEEPNFDPTNKMLYINPEECIDCGACEPECPVEAIFEEEMVPKEWKKFISMNYEFFGQEYDGGFLNPIFKTKPSNNERLFLYDKKTINNRYFKRH